MEKSSNINAVADDDDLYSSIEAKPDWSNFDILVTVAERERINLEKEKEETKLRKTLSTSLKFLDEQGTKDSIKNPSIDEKEREDSVKNSVIRLQIPIDQEKRSSPDTLLLKNFSQIPLLFELEDSKHQEEDGSGSGSSNSKGNGGSSNSKGNGGSSSNSNSNNNNNDGNIMVSCGSMVKKSSKRLRCIEEKTNQDEIMSKPKKVKMTNNYVVGLSKMPITTTIPEKFKNRILELGGLESSIVFVFQKVLTKTDVNPHHQRLLIPFKQVKNEFLTDEEKSCFQIRKQQYEINAVFIEPSLDDCRINLRQWDMSKDHTVSQNYSLVTHWIDVVRRNQLAEGMTVHLWAFRKGSLLGLALILVS